MKKGLIYALVILLIFGLQPYLWWWSLVSSDNGGQSFITILVLSMSIFWEIIIAYKIYAALNRKRA